MEMEGKEVKGKSSGKGRGKGEEEKVIRVGEEKRKEEKVQEGRKK